MTSLNNLRQRRRVLRDAGDMHEQLSDDYLSWLSGPISEDKQLAIVSRYNLQTLDMCRGVTERTLALHAMLWGKP